MKKVKVYIEETLCREIEIEVDENLSVDDRMEFAEEKVTEMYRNEEIVLTSDDYNGLTQICVEDVETQTVTGWFNI